jgi:hypothetical protein
MIAHAAASIIITGFLYTFGYAVLGLFRGRPRLTKRKARA